MNEKNLIKNLEHLSKQLHVSEDHRNKANDQVIAYGNDYMNKVSELPGYSNKYEIIQGLEKFSFNEQGQDLQLLIQAVQKYVDPAGVNPASGGHLGYIPGGGLYMSGLGDYMAAVSNQYAGIYFGGPGAVKMENMLIRWMCDEIGYPSSSFGNITTGGSIANLSAIVTARDFKKISGDTIKKSVVYMTEHTHHCVHKALRISGLQDTIWREVSVDEHHRMSLANLRYHINADVKAGLIPQIIVGSIGTTNTGVVDPIDEIATVAKEYDCWFHIDAAYGGFFILVDALKEKFKGIERADSVVMDPHKTLFLPYGIGVLLVKDQNALAIAHQYSANYMQDAEHEDQEFSPAEFSPELTKHFRGMRMWLPLQYHGLAPFRASLEEKWRLCLYFYEEIQKLGFEVGPVPELSVCIYRFVKEGFNTDELNKQILDEIHKDGRIFISSTTINGIFWLRIAIVGFRTHLKEIDLYLSILKQKIAQLLD